MDNAAVIAAAVKLGEVFDSYTLEDISTALTCREADALADLFRALGETETAEDFLVDHGTGDDEGDSHFQYEAREQ